jgi:hypothetical protein
MTKTMKPRAIWAAKEAGQVTEIKVRDEWHTMGALTLIGSSKWTIRNQAEEVLTSCSGGASFEVR